MDNGNISQINELQEKLCDECDVVTQKFSLEYANNYHVYLAMAVCLFGTVANILNIIVLTGKDMKCTPINKILTGLAVADMLIKIEYIPFAYYYYVYLADKRDFPYWAAVFMLFHTHFSQIFHTVSICLTLTLATWRFLAIRYPERNHIFCSEQRCIIGISLSFILPLILCIPIYLTFKIKSITIQEDKLYTLYHLDLSEIAKENDYLVLVWNFWMYAVVIKLLPCFILTIIISWLIRALYKAKQRRNNLRGYDACHSFENSNNKDKNKTKSERRADRTTQMLVAVLLLFLLTEFPQGIFGLLIGMKGKCIFLKCYQNFGAVMDILALTNGSINFILYCCMNTMFRLTFSKLFKPNVSKLMPSTHSDVNMTYV